MPLRSNHRAALPSVRALPLQQTLPCVPEPPSRCRRAASRRNGDTTYLVAGSRLPVVHTRRARVNDERNDPVDRQTRRKNALAGGGTELQFERLLAQWLIARSWLDRALDRLAEATGLCEYLGQDLPLATRWSRLPATAWHELRRRVDQMSGERASDPTQILAWIDAVSATLEQATDYRLGHWGGIDTSPRSVEPAARWIERTTLTPGRNYIDRVLIVSFKRLRQQRVQLDALVDQCARISHLLELEAQP